jgi:hypothetical protein
MKPLPAAAILILLAPLAGGCAYSAARWRDFTDIVSLGISSATILMGNSTTSPDVTFRRGDADGNGNTNITDAITVLGRLFLGGSPLYCEDAADSNDDGKVNLTDSVFVLLYLFLGGGAVPAPGPVDCGLDPTTDDLLECTRECK